MKVKQMICLAGLLILAGLAVFAQESGYKGPGMTAVTIDEAKDMRDDTPVMLQGKIERFLGDEKYLFSDGTDTIIIEIDRKVWGSLSVDQNDTVEITGEVDRDFRTIEVEVRTIRKL